MQARNKQNRITERIIRITERIIRVKVWRIQTYQRKQRKRKGLHNLQEPEVRLRGMASHASHAMPGWEAWHGLAWAWACSGSLFILQTADWDVLRPVTYDSKGSSLLGSCPLGDRRSGLCRATLRWGPAYAGIYTKGTQSSRSEISFEIIELYDMIPCSPARGSK